MNTQELEVLHKALSDHAGAIQKFTEQSEERQRKADERNAQLATRLLELEQKLDKRPATDGGNARGPSVAELLMKSDGFAAYQKGMTRAVEIKVPMRSVKAAILNATPLDGNQPLVPADRAPGIITPPQRRFTMRDVIPQLPTNSDVVQYTKELSYDNQAGPQGSGSSPVETEGQLFRESGMVFELATAPVITIGHWLPASRQVLADAPALQAHVDGRLMYGLKLEEETEILTADGSSGKLSGLIHNATAFAGGSTNLTAMDAVAAGLAQLIASEYAPSAIVLNPADWFSTAFLLAKNSLGDYILGEPGDMAAPTLWGLPCIVTNSMEKGSFLVMDAVRAATIYDREEANVRISEEHADFFVRGMVAILIEERVALAVQQPGALVFGALSYAG